MSLADFDALKLSIVDWINRPNLTVVTEDLIRLAEAHFDRELECREMEATVSYSVSSDTQALPADYLAHLSLNVTGDPRAGVIDYTAPDQLDAKRPQTGSPCLFTIVGDDMLFWPAPAEATAIKMRYRQRVPALGSGNATNWLLTKYPDAYLFGALAEASDYVADERKLAKYMARRDQAIAMINKVDKKKITQRRRVRPSGAVA